MDWYTGDPGKGVNFVMFMSSSSREAIKSPVLAMVSSVSPGRPIMNSPFTRMPFLCTCLTVRRISSRSTFDLCRARSAGSPDSMPMLTIQHPADLSVLSRASSTWPTRTAQLKVILSGFFRSSPQNSSTLPRWNVNRSS